MFSLAVVLYQLMSRRLLLLSTLRTAGADRQYAARVANGYRPAFLPDVPPRLWSIIDRCWQQVPSKRPNIDWVVLELEMALKVNACEAEKHRPVAIKGTYQSMGKKGSTSKAPPAQ